MVVYVGHWVSLIIYVLVLITVACAACQLKGAKLYGPISYIIPGFLVTLTFQASLFLVLQVNWITSDYNRAVGDLVAYAWLAFDYFNGFALLCFATALNIWLGWRVAPECKHKRRYTDV